MSRLRPRPSDRFLTCLSGFTQVLVVTHDNPDPDAIATSWAIAELVQQQLSKPVRIVAGGSIIRAENRQMVNLLNPPIELTDGIEVTRNTATVLVDCGPEGMNHLLSRTDVKPIAVIDHHRTTGRGTSLGFRDVRTNVVASASIGTRYLRDHGVDPGIRLASALLYAIHSETRGSETRFSRLDRSMFSWLSDRADPHLVAEIQNAPLARDYFADLVLGMQGTFVYDDVALCLLPHASGPEIVGEVADLLIRCEGVLRVLAGAAVGSDVLLSVRTMPGGGDASALVQETLRGLGHGGGHQHRAGGKIPDRSTGPVIAESLQEQIRAQWLAACGASRQRGTRLVARRDIVANL